MPSFDVSKLTFNRLYGTARLDYGTAMDVLVLDRAIDIAEPVQVSTMTIADGYTIGENGELSIDPTTATASISDYRTGAPTPDSPLHVGDRVDIRYDDVVIFQGSVAGLSCELNADQKAFKHGKDYKRKLTYTLSSLEFDLLKKQVYWGFLPDGSLVGYGILPQETAIQRLQRFGFTVDTSALDPSHLAQASVVVPQDPPNNEDGSPPTTGGGNSTLLDQLRYYSAATGLPVRIEAIALPLDYMNVVVLDTPVSWNGDPLYAVVLDSETWATTVTYAPSTLIPSGMTVVRNDTTFLGGAYTLAFDEAKMDVARLDVAELGPAPVRQVGFLAPDVVDCLGVPCAVSRITHSFTAQPPNYQCTLELAPPQVIEV